MARRVPVVENRSCISSSTPSKAAGSTPGKGAAASRTTGGSTADRSTADRSSVVTPTKNGGILHPPPDVRCIVDKTAEFVAQNGVEFEMKILSNEKRNPRFNFLKSKDTYHPYYQQRILEFLDQGQSPVNTAKPNACEGN
ncbi:unnamed protein product [Calypogeia fissa]